MSTQNLLKTKEERIVNAIKDILHSIPFDQASRAKVIDAVAELFAIRISVVDSHGNNLHHSDRRTIASPFASTAPVPVAPVTPVVPVAAPTETKKRVFTRDGGKFARLYKIATFVYPDHGEVGNTTSIRRVVLDQRHPWEIEGEKRGKLYGYDLTRKAFRSFDPAKVIGPVAKNKDYVLGIRSELINNKLL